MILVYQPLELRDDNDAPTGRWRQTYRCGDPLQLRYPIPLCHCSGGHESPAAARACPVVQANLPEELKAAA